jgi:hypothetical protein
MCKSAERFAERFIGLLAGAAPGFSRKIVEFGQVGCMWVSRGLRPVGQIPDVCHQHRGYGVDRLVAVEPFAE